MSFQAMSWAIAQKCGSSSSKMVLLMLANHANGHTGLCNPRHKTLADECEMRVETLKEHLKKLCALGLIEIIPQYAEGLQLPNHYRLNIFSDSPGGGGENHPGGGGENRPGGGGENRPPNNQEYNQEDKPTPIAPKGATPPRPSQIPRPDDVDEQTWGDWLALRKAKKAPVTKTVLERAKRESEKADMPLDAFLQVWCMRGSQGLQADWLKPSERQTASRQPLSYAQQDEQARRARWEEMTGRKWPESGAESNSIIDVDALRLDA